MKFGFGNIVVVEGNTEVGVVVKLWQPNKGEPNYDVYVRSFNSVKNYNESDIEHFIYNKQTTEQEQDYYLSEEEYLRKQGIDPDEFMRTIKKSMES